MERKGYRKSTKEFGFDIDTDVEQFSFSMDHIHLKVELIWNQGIELAPLERVKIYLKDKRLLENIFVVNSILFYYYEASWYYRYDDPRALGTFPEENIMDVFGFTKNDIVAIVSDNNAQPAKFDIWYWLALFKGNRLDSAKSIRQNNIINVSKWKYISKNDGDILYQINE